MLNTDILDWTDEIRSCHDCFKIKSKQLPVVFAGENPSILVVSEGPPKGSWEKDIGMSWKNGKDNGAPDLFFNDVGGIQRIFCNWLNLDEDKFENKVFWIHRRNCWIESENKKAKVGNVLNYCSDKFIFDSILKIHPELIVALGKPACLFFDQSGMMKDIVRVDKWPEVKNPLRTHEYQIAYLYHPAQRAKSLGYHDTPEQKAAIKKLKTLPCIKSMQRG